MSELSAALVEFTALVWESLFDEPIEPTAADDALLADPEAQAGEVSIHGAWSGNVSVVQSAGSARRVAAAMFGRDESDVEEWPLRSGNLRCFHLIAQTLSRPRALPLELVFGDLLRPQCPQLPVTRAYHRA